MRRPTAIEGSNTLGNIARRVPLRCRRCARLGLDASSPRSARRTRSRDAPRRRVRPHGRGVGREGLGHRPLGDDGHRARSAVPDVSARLSRRRHRRVRARDRPRRARQQGRVRHGDHRRARARSTCAPARRSSTPPPTACFRSPRTKTSCPFPSCIAPARSPTSWSAKASASAASSRGRSSARRAASSGRRTATTTRCRRPARRCSIA